ncbi:MAG TPA: hypothetical protein VKA06_11055, partial [Spirochaetia bacterium]|nr:hypothetical protein [Spirochaetia bacterium]
GSVRRHVDGGRGPRPDSAIRARGWGAPVGRLFDTDTSRVVAFPGAIDLCPFIAGAFDPGGIAVRCAAE